MVIKSPYPDVPVPKEDVWSFLLGKTAADEEKEIYICGVTSRSYNVSQLRSASIQFGKGLRSQWGLKHGDTIAIFSPNSVDYPAALFGALWAGLTISLANPTYTPEELAFQLKDSGAKALVTQLPLLPKALEAARKIGLPEDRIVLLDDARDPSKKFPHFTELRDTSLLGYSRAKVDPKTHVAFLCYSSGTTGLPKGVKLTHENLLSNMTAADLIEQLCGLSSKGGFDGKGDKQLAVLPFFHVYGLNSILLNTAYNHRPVVILPAFDLERALTIIQKYRVSFLYLAPPVILALAKSPLVDKFDVSSVKWINSGAAPLTSELVDAVWNRLTIPVKQGYGLSEASPVTHTQTAFEWAKYKGSIGKLIPNMEAKIVDLEDNEVPTGKEGEIWVKGPNVFSGYLNRPELNKDVFSKCGFLKTGDIGYVDPLGNFYITDRLKELIKYKGFQVAPAELEGVLVGHSDIADACVIPVFDKQRSTEVPRAYVVVNPGIPQTEEKANELIEWLATKVAPHKRLRGGLRFIDQVPKNISGKILRRVLKEQAKQEEKAQGSKL
ncbi:acetyl-CoA synthetase-like protein [Thozetella sp. PMI_491]|nr:acetyl-CoA synthetase-like protein [Thozetella sp. PMI_491]